MRWRGVSGGFTGTFKPIHRRFRGEKRREAALVGVDHEGAGTTMKPVSNPRFSLSLYFSLSLSPHLLQNTRGTGRHRRVSTRT